MAEKRQNQTRQPKDPDAIDRTADKLHESVDRLAEGARHVDETVRERKRQAEDNVASAVADAREQSELLLTKASGFVRANPLLSIGLAMLAGAILDRKLRR